MSWIVTSSFKSQQTWIRLNSARVRIMFAAEFVLYVANQVFAFELYIAQRIRCSLSNYVVRSESAFHC
jgi:hypothetical protein